MLRFAVYNSDGQLDSPPLVNAHLIGPEDQPVRGTAELSDGIITCTRKNSQATGFCLQFDAGPMGRLMLQTTLLPDREQPYHLALELARHRIKLFIAKCEEWHMLDLPSDHPAMRAWEKARGVFIDALTISDIAETEQAARRSLALAIESTERLARSHSDILLHRRFAQRAASSSTLGVRIWPARDGKALRDIVERDFDVVVIPMSWREMEVEEGRYNWEPTDRWIDWAHKAGKPIVAGPLLDFSRRALPDWMYVWQHDYDTCRDLAYDHVERVVGRYRSAVNIWNVGRGLNVNDNFTFTLEQMIDLIRMATLVIRQARKGARTMLEIEQPFGEHAARNKNAVAPLAFIDRVIQEGVRVDAIGVQVLFGIAGEGKTTRDLMAVSAMLDRFVYLEMPILVSALGAPSETVDPRGGSWHGEWSPEIQVAWLTRLFAIAISKPFVESIFWSELYDNERAIIPATGLISATGHPKPALGRLTGVRKRLRKPLGTRRNVPEDQPAS